MLALSIVALCLLGFVFVGGVFAVLGGDDEEKAFGAVVAIAVAVGIITIALHVA